MAMSLRRALLTTAVVGTALPAIFGRRAWWGWPLAHACLILPTVARNHGAWGPIVRGFRTDARELWLTIDDGPSPATTPGYLDVLDRYGVKATFFVIGAHVDANRALTREIVARGHALGNHTYRHPSAWWWALPRSAVTNEIERGTDAIFAATGCRPALFRSPVGMTGPWVHPALRRTNQRLIGWSASGLDGLDSRGDAVVHRIAGRLQAGGIVVLHESQTEDAQRVQTLDRVLARLTTDGWQCVIPGVEGFFE